MEQHGLDVTALRRDLQYLGEYVILAISSGKNPVHGVTAILMKHRRDPRRRGFRLTEVDRVNRRRCVALVTQAFNSARFPKNPSSSRAIT